MDMARFLTVFLAWLFGIAGTGVTAMAIVSHSRSVLFVGLVLIALCCFYVYVLGATAGLPPPRRPLKKKSSKRVP
jgi:hypothetical protein